MARRPKPEDNPSTTSGFYDVMRPSWAKIQTLLDGTEAMRAAGESYMPPHEAEEHDDYSRRLAKSVLLNRTRQTLESWVGRPFSDPVAISEDVPETMDEWLEDVDLNGNDVGVFAREWFREGLAKGYCHVLVDTPPTLPSASGGPRTLADDLADGSRPYAAMIRPENLFFATGQVVGGAGAMRNVLTHVRIMESVTSRVGFAEVTRRQIRVLDLVQGTTIGGVQVDPKVNVTVYKENLDRGTKTAKPWILDPTMSKSMDMDRIPLITFYANSEGFMLTRPPLEDLGDLNIRHWQSNSDQQNILDVARFPILAQIGGDEPATGILGPKRLWHVESPTGDLKYVEHTGAAIAAGREELKSLDDQMGEYGADFLRKRPGNTTATARALDSAEATSPLQDVALRFNDALQQLAEAIAGAGGLEAPKAALSVPVDFGPEVADAADLDALDKARGKRDISRRRHLSELQRRGVLGDDFDADENDQELEEESAGPLEGAPADGLPIDEGAEE